MFLLAPADDFSRHNILIHYLSTLSTILDLIDDETKMKECFKRYLQGTKVLNWKYENVVGKILDLGFHSHEVDRCEKGWQYIQIFLYNIGKMTIGEHIPRREARKHKYYRIYGDH